LATAAIKEEIEREIARDIKAGSAREGKQRKRLPRHAHHHALLIPKNSDFPAKKLKISAKTATRQCSTPAQHVHETQQDFSNCEDDDLPLTQRCISAKVPFKSAKDPPKSAKDMQPQTEKSAGEEDDASLRKRSKSRKDLSSSTLAKHGNTLHDSATHCNTLRRTATHCNTKDTSSSILANEPHIYAHKKKEPHICAHTKRSSRDDVPLTERKKKSCISAKDPLIPAHEASISAIAPCSSAHNKTAPSDAKKNFSDEDDDLLLVERVKESCISAKEVSISARSPQKRPRFPKLRGAHAQTASDDEDDDLPLMEMKKIRENGLQAQTTHTPPAHCNTLEHAATHSNTLQNTATHLIHEVGDLPLMVPCDHEKKSLHSSNGPGGFTLEGEGGEGGLLGDSEEQGGGGGGGGGGEGGGWRRGGGCNALQKVSPLQRGGGRARERETGGVVQKVCWECKLGRYAKGNMLWCVSVWCSMVRYVMVCCNVSQCVVVYRSVLQCAAVCYGVLRCFWSADWGDTPKGVCCSVLRRVAVFQCGAVCCGVLQCVALCCSGLQWVAVCCSVLQCAELCFSVLQCAAACCSVLQCVGQCAAVRCSVLQYAVVHCRCKLRRYTKGKNTQKSAR